MGVLEFEPNHNLKTLDSSTAIHVNEIIQIVQEIFNNRNRFNELLQQKDKRIIDILKIGTSAGGAKPKAIIAYNDATGEVRSGQVKAPQGFKYWLLKFDGGKFLEHDKICDNPQGIGKIEFAHSLRAKACEIEMTECRLLQEGDNFHFMTKRFDRTDDRDEIHSYEQVFEVMRKMELPFKMFRRMVFNVAGRNHDDHTKDHSFLMDEKGEWTLAPAYDLCYSYNPYGKYTRGHQLYINGKKENFSFEDLKSVSDLIGLKKGSEIINSIMDVIREWPKFAREAGVNRIYGHEIENKLLNLKFESLNRNMRR